MPRAEITDTAEIAILKSSLMLILGGMKITLISFSEVHCSTDIRGNEYTFRELKLQHRKGGIRTFPIMKFESNNGGKLIPASATRGRLMSLQNNEIPPDSDAIAYTLRALFETNGIQIGTFFADVTKYSYSKKPKGWQVVLDIRYELDGLKYSQITSCLIEENEQGALKISGMDIQSFKAELRGKDNAEA